MEASWCNCCSLFDPKHVHVFEDRKRLVKFNIENWTVMEGTMTRNARKALEALRKEGII
jgi:hypothetical protein